MRRLGVVPTAASTRLADFKIAKAEETNQVLVDAGVNLLTHQTRLGRSRIQVDREDLDLHADLLRDLIKQATTAATAGR